MSLLENLTGKSVELMPQTRTWAQGYHSLQAACYQDQQAGLSVLHPTHVLDGEAIYRPLTVEEIMLARLNNWDLGTRWDDSCSSITYGPNGLFKISLISDALLHIHERARPSLIIVEYDSLVADGINVQEFNGADGLYNTLLTKAQAKAHPVWQFAGRNTLDQYVERQWEGQSSNYTAMNTHLVPNLPVGETRALFVKSHGDSNLIGGWNDSGGSFTRVMSSRAQ